MKIFNGNKEYSLYNYENEANFEKDIFVHASRIFGESTIYINKKKQIKGSDIITIPDAFLIDMTNSEDPKLFIIENEIVGHDPFKHIGIQLLKFATTFEESKVELRNYLMEQITSNKNYLNLLQQGCLNSKYRNIDNYLDQAVYGDFRALVIIDEAREELHNVIKKINANISVLEFKNYRSSSNDSIYLYNTLYEDDNSETEFTSQIQLASKESNWLQNSIKRRSHCDTVVVPAREEGFQAVFLGQNQWYAIRIAPAMKERIKYIAAYQIAPVSAITYVAEVDSIIPYENTGKYLVKFKDKAREISPIKPRDSNRKPQGPIYIKYEDLFKLKYIEELWEVK